MFILTVLVLIVGAVYAYIHYSFTYWERKGIIHIKPKLPFGNAGQIGRTKHLSTAFTEFYNELKGKGKFGGVYLTFRPVLVLTDLDLIKNVLVRDFNIFPNR
jgi:cytochrome P450 family 6